MPGFLNVASPTAKTATAGDADYFPEVPFLERWRDTILGAISVGLFLAAWQWFGTAGFVNPIFTSSPGSIVEAFVAMANKGILQSDILESSRHFGIGFGLAILIGVPLGIITGRFRTANSLTSPFIISFYVSPNAAFMPLFVLWLGIGLWSKVALIFLAAIFPLVINMQTAMRTLDADLLKAAYSFGASQWTIFRTIALPSAVPFLISGLRLALGRALVGVFVAELFAGSSGGVGYRIVISASLFRTSDLFVAVGMLILAGLFFNRLFLSLERRFGAWRPATRK